MMEIQLAAAVVRTLLRRAGVGSWSIASVSFRAAVTHQSWISISSNKLNCLH
mgnify:CR=1 FL=1